MMDDKDLYRMPPGFTESNFKTIKESLIKTAKTISELKDYDYDGSTLNSFMGIQAYSLLKQELFANIVLTETNIYTAKDRRSVVQLAQRNGYIPNGLVSSKLTISIKAKSKNNNPTLKIPRGTKFQGKQRDDGDAYRFIAIRDSYAVRGDGGYYYPTIDLAQGRVLRLEMRYQEGIPILINDLNIDRNEIRVWVNNAEWTNWTYKNIVDITGGSTVFYVRETYDGETEIRFGVGEVTFAKAGHYQENNYIGGLKPQDGDKIVVEYLRTDGSKANGCRIFTFNDVIRDVTVEEIYPNYNNDPNFIGSFGGGIHEDIENIRENGILALEAQRRAVTDTDWETLLDRKYAPIIQAREVYSPEGNNNLVAVAIKPRGSLYLTKDQIRDIRDYLSQYPIGRLKIELITPKYLFVQHNITVRYKNNELDESQAWLQNKIIDSITKFYKEEVEFFNMPLHKSKLLTAIDSSHSSIKGSSAVFDLVREEPNFFETSYLGSKFYNLTKEGSFKSKPFLFIANPEHDDSEMEKHYYIFLQSVKTEDGKSEIIVGPFVKGDVDSRFDSYNKDDIDRPDWETIEEEKQTEYYVVGSIDHKNDFYEWSFGKIGLKTNNFSDPFIELTVIPVDEDVISVDKGCLLIYENDMRPQYTKFKWIIE